MCYTCRKVKSLSPKDVASPHSSESLEVRILEKTVLKNESKETISSGQRSSETIFCETDEENATSDSLCMQSYKDDFLSRRKISSFDGLNKRCLNRNEIGLDILKAQIQLGADPKKMLTHGDRTCLMCAVLAEDFSFIKELVQYGVDVKQTNCAGETALRFAMELGREDIANFLRTKGAE